MIIGKYSALKGAIIFVLVVIAILNIIAASFAPGALLLCSGIASSIILAVEAILIFRYFDTKNID